MVHHAVLILLESHGAKKYLEDKRRNYKNTMRSGKNRNLDSFMFSRYDDSMCICKIWVDTIIGQDLAFATHQREITGARSVIRRGNARNLTEALLVVSGSNTHDMARFIGTIFNKVYRYAGGGLHLCNHPAITDVINKAK